MAGNQRQQSDNSYFSSLLKIWDLEDVDDKILLETAAPGYPPHSGTGTESWLSGAAEELSTHVCEHTPLTYSNSRKPDIEDTSFTGIDSGSHSHCVLSHSKSDSDSVFVCSACRHSNEAAAHWCSECGRALIGNGWDCSDDDDGTSTTCTIDCASNTAVHTQRCDEDPMHHKVRHVSDTSNLRSTIAKINEDLLKHSSQHNDSADASEIQDSPVMSHAKCFTMGAAEVHKHEQSQNTRRNFTTHTSAYLNSLFISKNTTNDDPMELLPHNGKENERGCKPVPVHQRRWDSSSTYMWRKPATLRSKVSSPSDSATCSAVLHTTSCVFHTDSEQVHSKQDLPMDNSFNCHGKSPRSSSGIPSRSVQIPRLALDGIKDVGRSVPSGVRLYLAPAFSLLSLPDELLLIILSYLRLPQLVACLRVCRRLGQIAADSSLWKCIIFNGKKSCLSETVLQIAAKRRPKVIVFSHCRASITTKQLQAFFESLSGSLQSLRVDTCDFGSQTGDTLLTTAVLHCPHLASIDISWTQLSDRALKFAVEHCRRLEAVSLEQTPEISLKTLKLLAKHHEGWLMALKVKGKLNFIKSTIEAIAKLFEQASNLATFAVTCTEVEEEHIQRFVAFHKLTDLEIQCTSITETAVRCLSQIPLESLTLTALLPLSATCLAHISEMNTLRHFSTSFIDDSGIQTLCSGRLHLESLHLSKCDITEIGFQSIAMNGGLTNSLTSLKIDSYRNQHKLNEAFVRLIRKCTRLKPVTPGTHADNE